MKIELMHKYCWKCPQRKVYLGLDYCMQIEEEWLKAISPTFYIGNKEFIVPEGCIFHLELMMEGVK